MIKDAISYLISGDDLSEAEMMDVMNEIMEGKATDAQIGAFLTALRIKGETIDEITGAVKVMRQKAIKIQAPTNVIDTCGTGGDMSGTFNISTVSAIVASACGVAVAKHGNRSVSSQTGSADVLEELGVNINLSPSSAERCLQETGFVFLFAPLYHPAMKYAIGPRKELGIRTIFNILGPLTNPAGAKRQVVGVFSKKLTEQIATVLGRLGAEDAIVVHAEDRMDEISISGRTKVSRFKNGIIDNYYIHPDDFGFKPQPKNTLLGLDKARNAEIALSILKGEKSPMRDVVVMNASVAVIVSGLTDDYLVAKEVVQSTIDEGKALQKLNQIVKVSKALASA